MNYTFNTTFNKMVDFLLENANPSIVFHIKNDILNDIAEEEKQELQNKVMQEKTIQSIIGCQKESGWLGNNLHGPHTNEDPYLNQEVGVKYLGEKLVYKDTPVLKNAIEAFKTGDCGAYVMDGSRYAASGSDIIMAACVARAGYEDLFDISREITIAINSFRRVLEVNTVKDIVTIKKKRPERVNPDGIVYAFNDNEKWPCWYHLDILAHANSWRSKENIAMVAEAFNKLLCDNGLDYEPGYCVDIGHLVGCCGALREGMKLGVAEKGAHKITLDYIEYMCRCGLYGLVPELKKEVDTVLNSIDEKGICRADYYEKALRGMGTYSGGQLEVDWKSSTRRLCDVTYRALLILYYSDLHR